MQTFEFHFNPPQREKTGKEKKAKNDLIFDSFCFEPANFYEKKLGGLYLAGSLTNTLPQNNRFLDSLAKVIKERYYKTTAASSEKSLKESLKKANEYLEKVAKGGDVSWLGNLSFMAAAITQKPKGGELNFTKIGGLNVFLLRNGQVTNIDQKLKFEEIEPYPLKIFGNIVSGKLVENDIILIMTKEISDFFQSQNMIDEISQLNPFDQRKLKEILNRRKESLAKISGLCLLVLNNKESQTAEKEVLAEEKTFQFPLKRFFAPIPIFFKATRQPAKQKKTEEKANLFHPKMPKLPKLPSIGRPKINSIAFALNKKLLLIAFMIVFLAAGFFIFQRQEKKQLVDYQSQLEQIRQETNEAGNYIGLAETNPEAEKKASDLLKDAWSKINPLANISSDNPGFTNQVNDLKKTITDDLYKLNKLQDVGKIQPFFEIKSKEFAPQKMVIFKDNLYFFNSYSDNFFELRTAGSPEGKIIPTSKKLNLAVPLKDSVLFFSRPNILVVFKDGKLQESINLENPYPDFNFKNVASYLSNLYFLDDKKGEIIKYSYIKNFKWGPSQIWLNPKIKKTIGAKSLAANSSIWVLTKDNSIERYYSGNLEETINFDVFPYPKAFSKILTNGQLGYLYILDPAEKRIIIVDKSGKLVKQFRSDNFDNLLDFSPSDDGKTIWILNGLKVYKVAL